VKFVLNLNAPNFKIRVKKLSDFKI